MSVTLPAELHQQAQASRFISSTLSDVVLYLEDQALKLERIPGQKIHDDWVQMLERDRRRIDHLRTALALVTQQRRTVLEDKEVVSEV